MSRLFRIVSSLLCVVVMSNVIGCATFQSPFDKKLPKATASNPVVEIVCLWQPGEGRDPEGAPCKGFMGQILFLSRNSSTPVQIEGDVRIYLFDDQGTVEEQSKPLRQFDFDNGSWAIHLTDSSFGPTYSVFVPYVRRGTSNAACSLRVRLKAKQGPIVFSDFTNMQLNGHKKSATGEDAKPITKEEVDRFAAEAMSGALRRTTTISTGPISQTTEVAVAAKKETNSNQVQLASHEVIADSTKETAKDSADADRIRRLETMVQQLLEQKVNSTTPANARPSRNSGVEPEPLNDEPNVSNLSGEGPKSSRRLKLRRNDEEESTRITPRRRAHPLDDNRPVPSRAANANPDELVQEPSPGDASESAIETTYLPQSSVPDQRYRRSSR